MMKRVTTIKMGKLMYVVNKANANFVKTHIS